ncbi:MAG: thioredoxin domain-containing protein, partial [Gallionellaceae bacterium]|nr:thioredoxin domain-containing protein [Gallionellaceae bacterium]
IAQRLHLSIEQVTENLTSARQKLFATRAQRVHPGRDEKILGAWNGLMITGMARAARVFQRRDWLHSAQRALDFVRRSLWHDGKLLATCRNGKAHLNAYLDDHTFLLQAALELLQADFRRDDLAFAEQLAAALLARFEDSQNGGFFFTSHDHEALIQRNKIGQDNATPAGNGIAAQALQRLAALTGKPEYAAASERCLMLFFPVLQQAASYHCGLCSALADYLQPQAVLVLRGEAGQTSAWQSELQRHYLPSVIALTLHEQAACLPQILNKPQSAQSTAWLCAGTQCLPPITRLDELLERLASA